MGHKAEKLRFWTSTPLSLTQVENFYYEAQNKTKQQSKFIGLYQKNGNLSSRIPVKMPWGWFNHNNICQILKMCGARG